MISAFIDLHHVAFLSSRCVERHFGCHNEAAKLFWKEQEKDLIPMVQFLLGDLPQQRLPSAAMSKIGSSHAGRFHAILSFYITVLFPKAGC